jgi:hypothetical protein
MGIVDARDAASDGGLSPALQGRNDHISANVRSPLSPPTRKNATRANVIVFATCSIATDTSKPFAARNQGIRVIRALSWIERRSSR